MITSKQCYAKFGDPEKELAMTVLHYNNPLLPVMPRKIYCNELIADKLEKAFALIIARGLEKEVKTWDGCFNIRRKRGATSMSLHSWGLAIDINAAWNRFGQTPTMSKELVACFEESGFDWGGRWSNPDGMHFQLSKF